MTDEAKSDLTRPIAGIENRTAQEVFDLMSDRIRRRRPSPGEPTPDHSGDATDMVAPSSPGGGDGLEPVAWRWDEQFMGVWRTRLTHDRPEPGPRVYGVQPLFTRPTPATPEGLREKVARAIYEYLDERFPGGALPGGVQLFADPGDDLDPEMKHEAGCEAMADAILAALQPQGGEG